MKAQRAAQLIVNPRGNRKVFNQKTKAIKVHKPETILAMARSKRNHDIRYRRVLKKGMQTRASDKLVKKTKVVVPEGLASAEEEAEMKKEVQYAANSVGAKMVFVIRIREPHGMPEKVKKILNALKLKNVNAVSFCSRLTRVIDPLKILVFLISSSVSIFIFSGSLFEI
jgi:ribosomal protein L30/L7E